MLESNLLLHWFAMNPNPDFDGHPKASALPIGLYNQNSKRIESLEPYLRQLLLPNQQHALLINF